MQVITLQALMGTSREVHCPHGGFISYRYLLKRDGLGFSVHRTVVPKGRPQHWHYTEHLEACFCVSGKGILTNRSTGHTFLITPDTCYVLDNHDDHTFEALEDTVLISVFNPPVIGTEVHRDDGSYAPPALVERLEALKHARL